MTQQSGSKAGDITLLPTSAACFCFCLSADCSQCCLRRPSSNMCVGLWFSPGFRGVRGSSQCFALCAQRTNVKLAATPFTTFMFYHFTPVYYSIFTSAMFDFYTGEYIGNRRITGASYCTVSSYS